MSSKGPLEVSITLAFDEADADTLELVATFLQKSVTEIVSEVLVEPTRKHMLKVIADLRFAALGLDWATIKRISAIKRRAGGA